MATLTLKHTIPTDIDAQLAHYFAQDTEVELACDEDTLVEVAANIETLLVPQPDFAWPSFVALVTFAAHMAFTNVPIEQKTYTFPRRPMHCDVGLMTIKLCTPVPTYLSVAVAPAVEDFDNPPIHTRWECQMTVHMADIEHSDVVYAPVPELLDPQQLIEMLRSLVPRVKQSTSTYTRAPMRRAVGAVALEV